MERKQEMAARVSLGELMYSMHMYVLEFHGPTHSILITCASTPAAVFAVAAPICGQDSLHLFTINQELSIKQQFHEAFCTALPNVYS